MAQTIIISELREQMENPETVEKVVEVLKLIAKLADDDLEVIAIVEGVNVMTEHVLDKYGLSIEEG